MLHYSYWSPDAFIISRAHRFRHEIPLPLRCCLFIFFNENIYIPFVECQIEVTKNVCSLHTFDSAFAWNVLKIIEKIIVWYRDNLISYLDFNHFIWLYFVTSYFYILYFLYSYILYMLLWRLIVACSLFTCKESNTTVYVVDRNRKQ